MFGRATITLGIGPHSSICDVLDSVYSSIVSTLQTAANMFVLKCRKGFFKYWWDEELHVLKDAAIESNYGRPME